MPPVRTLSSAGLRRLLSETVSDTVFDSGAERPRHAVWWLGAVCRAGCLALVLTMAAALLMAAWQLREPCPKSLTIGGIAMSGC